MAEENKSLAPIIIKRVKKGGHAAHGGAWKIAYADFVTAMMAFFLLLWLLNSVTQEQLEGISDYFAPTTASQSTSGSGDILGGATITVDGSLQDDTSRPQVTIDLPPPKAGTGGEGSAGENTTNAPEPEEITEEERKAVAEERQFQEAQQALQDSLEQMPEFQQLAQSLMVDNTPEGLRIQIVDQDGLAMFASGRADMYDHTVKLMELALPVIMSMPQNISITGHTDAVPFKRADGYSNWELSADRANAARKVLMDQGVPESRLSHVVGKAATDPLLADDPKNARNRRLSIIMLRGTGAPPEPEEPTVRESILKP